MASYNGSTYLAEQLKSFAAQTRVPDELVVTDDVSMDTTALIINEFKKTVKFPIRFCSNAERLGSNLNFQRAISLCRSDVILFSDQDDVWLPTHIQRITEAFEADKRVGVVVSCSDYVDAKLKPQGVNTWGAMRLHSRLRRRAAAEWQFPAWARQRFALGHGMGIRSALREIAFPITASWNYDDWFAIVGAASSRGVLIEKPLSLHRKHERQSVGHEAKPLSLLYAQRPRSGAYFDSEIAAWSDLLVRLESNKHKVVDKRVFTYIRGRIAFLKQRRKLFGFSTVSRMTEATRLLLARRYHAYGRGWLAYARDLAG